MKNHIPSSRSEQRQHINLSQHTYDIISEDSFSFWGETNISGIINAIILGSWQTSDASISIAANNYREKLSETIKTEKRVKHLSDDEKATVEYCVNGYIKELVEKTKGVSKDVILKIRLQNEIFDELYPEDGSVWSESKYYSSPGQYIKALCEDYASKTYYEREAIIYKDNIDLIQPHIENAGRKQILSITYISASGKQHRYNVKPLRISTEMEANYHYLICLSQPQSSESNEYTQASLRISRITGVKAHAPSYGSGKITADQRKELNDAISKKGVAFLFTDTDKYVVDLTKEGVSKYNQITHLRPNAEKKIIHKDGSGTFTFDCTAAQIKYYFFSFGKDAKIISHQDICEAFKNDYLLAAEKYS